VECAGGTSVQGRTIIVATGAAYRRLPLPNLSQFEGAGVYYGATQMEAQLCAGEEVVVVGGGNSAGQAAVFLSGRAKHVHMLVRASGLAESMSRYLIRRIEDSPAITLRTQTQIVALEGTRTLERLTWRNTQTGETETREIRHVFSMTGASPNTAWLDGCLLLDDKHFVKTGADLSPEEVAAANWPLRRSPYLFETSWPGVFAVGDVRSSSVKRVASAVGEGSVAVQLIHKVLAE
jgi:thioredoxin reductase (NADPH)